MDAGGVLGDYVAVAVAAGGCAGCRFAFGMRAGDGVVTGCAAESGMGGMAKTLRVDIVLSADLCLISVACDTGVVFPGNFTKRRNCSSCRSCRCNEGQDEQHHGNAMLRWMCTVPVFHGKPSFLTELCPDHYNCCCFTALLCSAALLDCFFMAEIMGATWAMMISAHNPRNPQTSGSDGMPPPTSAAETGKVLAARMLEIIAIFISVGDMARYLSVRWTRGSWCGEYLLGCL